MSLVGLLAATSSTEILAAGEPFMARVGVTCEMRRVSSLKPGRRFDAGVGGERELELLVAEICDSILRRLNRGVPEHVEPSSMVAIQSSVPVLDKAKPQVFKDVQEASRQWLLERLREILEIAMQRVTNPKTPAPDRIKWSRIVIAAAQASNAVLRDAEIETLKQQIAELKALTLAKLGEGDVEDRADQTRDEETPADG
jgi:hypothetical protein